MKSFATNNTNIPDKIAIEDLKSDFDGRIIDQDSPEYDAARQVWNAMIDRRPRLIAMCSNTADVVKAVRFARTHDLPASVRSSGHNVAGRALCNDGIVIDVSKMKAISVAADSNIVTVQAGATLGELDGETAEYGLAVPTGVAPPTGIAGLTLGGGGGWLTRKYGMTCDNLVGCEVVTAAGDVLTADWLTNPDLFWALRGGGGNFGIVTKFHFRAHRVSTVLGGLVLHTRDQAVELLRYYREFMKSAPDELTVYVGFLSAPDGTPIVAIAICYCGDLAEGEDILRPLRAFGTPILDNVQPIPFVEMQKIAHQPIDLPTRNYWRSVFLEDLSDGVIDILIEHCNRPGSPLTGTVIQLFGGAASRVPEAEMAFAHRSVRYNITIEAQWVEPDEDDRHIQWARAFSAALKPFSRSGHLLNFLNDEEGDAVRQSFGPNYERLAALKAKYDPTNFFRYNQNILPAPDSTERAGLK